jgi:hypothetical protein
MTSDKAPGTYERPSLDEHAPVRRIIYLACPYTHPDSKVREQRFHAATTAAAVLITRGYIVYSPITMTHPIDVALAGVTETLGSDYWVSFDEAFMDACSEMVILKIEGWESSNGIRREMEYFQKRGKPVSFMLPVAAHHGWEPIRNVQK